MHWFDRGWTTDTKWTIWHQHSTYVHTCSMCTITKDTRWNSHIPYVPLYELSWWNTMSPGTLSKGEKCWCIYRYIAHMVLYANPLCLVLACIFQLPWCQGTHPVHSDQLQCHLYKVCMNSYIGIPLIDSTKLMIHHTNSLTIVLQPID